MNNVESDLTEKVLLLQLKKKLKKKFRENNFNIICIYLRQLVFIFIFFLMFQLDLSERFYIFLDANLCTYICMQLSESFDSVKS